MKSLETNRGINTALVYAALGAGALLMIFPFIWMVFTSFKSAGESVQIPPTILPKQWMKENYLRAIASLPIMKLYVNTALLILFRVLCAVAFSSAAGFAFAKLKFKGKNLLFSLVIVQMMLPSQIFIIPQYQMLAGMGLTNSMFALVFPGLVSAFGTFFLRQAYMGIPDELGEAAYLDGCTRWQTFTKVMMPLTKASMAALTIVRVCRPDVASDCQHRPEHDDPVSRPFHPERTVYHQLSGADGRLCPGHGSHGDSVSGIPEAVY
jgi:multiple sugar transport system permease protein